MKTSAQKRIIYMGMKKEGALGYYTMRNLIYALTY
jgi:hypothetical protein